MISGLLYVQEIAWGACSSTQLSKVSKFAMFKHLQYYFHANSNTRDETSFKYP